MTIIGRIVLPVYQSNIYLNAAIATGARSLSSDLVSQVNTCSGWMKK